MASTKNVQALNNRLDLACRNRVGEFYRQHVSSMARLEHDKLDTVRLLQSVKKCPSNQEPLSVKFLGPPPKPEHHHQVQQHRRPIPKQNQRRPGAPADANVGDSTAAGAAGAATEDAADPDARLRQLFRGPPQTAAIAAPPENPFAPASNSQHYFPFMQQQQQQLERSKTFAGAPTQQQPQQQTPRASRHKHRRSRTPFTSKLERFYTHLEDTKQSCGLIVVDSTQTKEAYQFCGTLTQAEWRAKLSRLDPEYFKNLADASGSDEND